MSGRQEQVRLKTVQQAGQAAASSIFTVATPSGHVLTISEFITLSDEVARRRLDNMNKKLRDLEMHMAALEAEISKANDLPTWS